MWIYIFACVCRRYEYISRSYFTTYLLEYTSLIMVGWLKLNVIYVDKTGKSPAECLCEQISMQYQHGQCVIAAGWPYRAYALYLRVGIVRALAFRAIRTWSRHTFLTTLCALHKNATFANELPIFYRIHNTWDWLWNPCVTHCETDDMKHSCTLTNSIIDWT